MKAKKIISVILTGIVAASMLAGCGSSSRSQTDNTESSSQNEASSSSVSVKKLVLLFNAGIKMFEKY